MPLFSERYGYIKPSSIIIREKMTPEVQNAICTCFDMLESKMENLSYVKNDYLILEEYLWVYFLNRRQKDFHSHRCEPVVATQFLESDEPWYRKLDLIDATIKFLYTYGNGSLSLIANKFIEMLNTFFERLNFAYRIVGKQVIEITSNHEIKAIETALETNSHNIAKHLNKALELYSQRPIGDYRNSIKESISAVEAFCRERTSEDTLGRALKKLSKDEIHIPSLLLAAYEKLYAYTNQPDTGIRHALMETNDSYEPKSEEALYMIISCSAFINYLNTKYK